jgi:hypothetical protein
VDRKRNDSRYVEVQGHGQRIDGKNDALYATYSNVKRDWSWEGIIVRRPDAAELLKLDVERLI